jgi:hypothetical protein
MANLCTLVKIPQILNHLAIVGGEVNEKKLLANI